MISRVFIVSFLLIGGYTVGAQSAVSTIASPKVKDLGWMAGCWEVYDPAKQRRITEQWMAPDGGAMIGMSRTVRNGAMTGFEFLRIVSDGQSVKYVSRPSENTTDTEFRISKSSKNEVIFENPAHDFPQRIIYKLNGDKLNARIEGTMNGKTSGIDFPYARVACR